MFQQQIRALRQEAHMSQRALAAKLGISQQALAKYEKGQSSPNPDMLAKIAEIFQVTADYLLNGGMRHPGARTIPVLGQVAAGTPIDAIQDQEGLVALSPGMQEGDYFALRIHGQSMEPRMREGDVVIVRRQSQVDSGETAVVMVENDTATCKKVTWNKDGLTLLPTNPAYDPLYFSAEDVQQLPVRILGKVVELRAKY